MCELRPKDFRGDERGGRSLLDCIGPVTFCQLNLTHKLVARRNGGGEGALNFGRRAGIIDNERVDIVAVHNKAKRHGTLFHFEGPINNISIFLRLVGV